ncbi:glycosyltransferase [Epidermidibacterium keratini]|uniref:Glycosyltransferase n=1 Tax=Epidermidibacterium keratini TaxID=1891644 RepID=A0A7L4YRK6_9ACTN|nr:glycosyltransferase family 2 protein [Epidermidibacterium keratini]QHC01544.1 glycosyltransferase [Epidermidibacterium keratini]
MKHHPDVTVVVVTYSPGDQLDSFLDSLRLATRGPLPRVVLVDNGSVDGAPERAARREGVELVRSGGNVGFGAAANIGIRRSDTEWVLVANPDIAWRPGALDVLLDAARRWPDAGAIGPAILTPDGELYPSARLIPTLGVGIGHAVLGPVWSANPWSRAYRAEADNPSERVTGWISGSCMLLRRTAAQAVGGFDERYFMYFEDVDLCDRLEQAGYDVVYAPSAVVVHAQGHAASRQPTRMMAEHHRSAYRFLARRYPGWRWAPVRMALKLGLATRLWLSVKLGRVAEGPTLRRRADVLPDLPDTPQEP